MSIVEQRPTEISLHNTMSLSEVDIALEKADEMLRSYFSKKLPNVTLYFPRQNIKNAILSFFETAALDCLSNKKEIQQMIGIKIHSSYHISFSDIKSFKLYCCSFFMDIPRKGILHQGKWEMVHAWPFTAQQSLSL